MIRRVLGSLFRKKEGKMIRVEELKEMVLLALRLRSARGWKVFKERLGEGKYEVNLEVRGETGWIIIYPKPHFPLSGEEWDLERWRQFLKWGVTEIKRHGGGVIRFRKYRWGGTIIEIWGLPGAGLEGGVEIKKGLESLEVRVGEELGEELIEKVMEVFGEPLWLAVEIRIF
jgi:hypothetical protein